MNTKTNNKTKHLLPTQKEALLLLLQERFEGHMHRHKGLKWSAVAARLEKASSETLWSLHAMEETGGEPDVISRNPKTGAYLFCDCVAESPSGRRSLCYDDDALDARKEHKPKGTALGMAADMGIELLTEEGYHALQQVEVCDMKTSSWIQTPTAVRELGGALFGDRRYERVFIYHNGAESYYAGRGWRGVLRV
jgi:hypothetical protein